MSVTNPLSADNENVIKIHDKAFDTLIVYQVSLTERYACSSVVVDVDDVIFCDDIATLFFTLSCIPKGEYKMQILNKADSSIIYDNISTKVY